MNTMCKTTKRNILRAFADAQVKGLPLPSGRELVDQGILASIGPFTRFLRELRNDGHIDGAGLARTRGAKVTPEGLHAVGMEAR